MEQRDISQSGMTLISVIVAATITSVVALVTADLISNQAAAVSYLEDRLSKNSLETIIKANLGDVTACMNTIGARPFAPTSGVTSLRDKNNVPLLPTNDYDRINITTMSLDNSTMTGTPGESGVMNLVVNIDRDRRGGGPSELTAISIPLNVSTDVGTNAISSCGAVGSTDQSAGDCLSYTVSSATKINDSYAPGGNYDLKEGDFLKVQGPLIPGEGETYTEHLCINGRIVTIGSGKGNI